MPDNTDKNNPAVSDGNDGDLISGAEKVIAGIILILTTFCVITLIIGYWPDKLPQANKSSLYHYKLFHIELIEGCDSARVVTMETKSKNAEPDSVKKTRVTHDSLAVHDSAINKKPAGVKEKIIPAKLPAKKWYCRECEFAETIQLNTLLLILVALCGFLGNMIHVATSFTTFVGAEKFKRSWILWYWVKPFTASALAVAFYFVFRAGFLNYASDAGLNLYGVMTMAMLTGLFTDIATQKLKEVFEVAFKPKDDRPNTLSGNGISITEVLPNKLDRIAENAITIKGENLDKTLLTIKINTEIIPYQLMPDKSIAIKYKVPPSQSAAVSFKLEILNKEGKLLYTTNLTS